MAIEFEDGPTTDSIQFDYLSKNSSCKYKFAVIILLTILSSAIQWFVLSIFREQLPQRPFRARAMSTDITIFRPS